MLPLRTGNRAEMPCNLTDSHHPRATMGGEPPPASPTSPAASRERGEARPKGRAAGVAAGPRGRHLTSC